MSTAYMGAGADELYLAALQKDQDPLLTGRLLLTLGVEISLSKTNFIESQLGLRMARAEDFEDSRIVWSQLGDAQAVLFGSIGVVLLSEEKSIELLRHRDAGREINEAMQVADRECFVFTAGTSPHANLSTSRTLAPLQREAAEVDTVTWGLAVCGADRAQESGAGIKVAVLDTGFDLLHPDFAGRAFTSFSFVGDAVQDIYGHGTHTGGTACGPVHPAGSIPRYGIASGSDLFIGKIISNSGVGLQAQVLAGMNWAISNKCPVISMSVSSRIPVNAAYTAAGAAALREGCLIVAAAGNYSIRPGSVEPAGAPANSPTILSVGALDRDLQVAVMSNGGKIDLVAPGSEILSAWPRPTLHKTLGGTSTATPHVAGCAALWAQSDSNLRGAALRDKLLHTATQLPLPREDVGSGLVQAPTS